MHPKVLPVTSCPEVFILLFPSRWALDVELGGVRWGGVRGLCEALVGQLPPFPTALSGTVVLVTCAGVTLSVSPAGLCLGLPQTAARTRDTVLQVTAFSHFHRLCPHPRCFRFPSFVGLPSRLFRSLRTSSLCAWRTHAEEFRSCDVCRALLRGPAFHPGGCHHAVRPAALGSSVSCLRG